MGLELMEKLFAVCLHEQVYEEEWRRKTAQVVRVSNCVGNFGGVERLWAHIPPKEDRKSEVRSLGCEWC